MASRPYVQTTWRRGRVHIAGELSMPNEVTLAYIDCPPSKNPAKGTIILIHGFPQTSYQFRHVITPLAQAGYRVIAPDYRGAGDSSHPRGLDGYTKSAMAADIHALVGERLRITKPVHVVGHDIGAMIAHAYALAFPTQTVAWGECPLPGTTVYESVKSAPHTFHFGFHGQPDLPEALVAGRERMYLEHFYARHAHNAAAIGDADIEHYVRKYQQAGALRCAFDTYRTFAVDAAENRAALEKGKCRVPALALAGRESPWWGTVEGMVSEVYENVKLRGIAGSGHWCAEENPEDFVAAILSFVGEHS